MYGISGTTMAGSWWSVPTSNVFFFFQAEDGIRDLTVTGVQTCALPIWRGAEPHHPGAPVRAARHLARPRDRKSTRLNSSHSQISYAVFCLKKKKTCKHHCSTGTSTQRRLTCRLGALSCNEPPVVARRYP